MDRYNTNTPRIECGIAALSVGLSLFGCASASKIYNVEVLSEPPGARIEVNNDYVGDAPLTVAMSGNSNREVDRHYVVKAFPRPGQLGWVQKKLFWHFGLALPSDRIPERIYFDTMLEPGPDVDVRLRR